MMLKIYLTSTSVRMGSTPRRGIGAKFAQTRHCCVCAFFSYVDKSLSFCICPFCGRKHIQQVLSNLLSISKLEAELCLYY